MENTAGQNKAVRQELVGSCFVRRVVYKTGIKILTNISESNSIYSNFGGSACHELERGVKS